MGCPRLNPGVGNGLDHLPEGLCLGKGVLGLGEGRVEMGIDARHGDVVVVAVDGENFFQFFRQEAIAAHAGVDFHMDLCHQLPLGGQGVESRGVLRRADGGDDVQIQQPVQFPLVGRGPQHQNLCVLVLFPDDLCLVQLRHGKPAHALFPAQRRHGRHTQAIAISLEHRPDRGLPRLFQQHIQIVPDGIRFHDVGFHGLTFQTMQHARVFQLVFLLPCHCETSAHTGRGNPSF